MDERGVMGMQCAGNCDGRPESHNPDDVGPMYAGNPADLDTGPGDPALWVPGLAMWPGGQRGPVCGRWSERSRFVGHVNRALHWAIAGQHVGVLDDQPPAFADAFLVARGEWDRITAEEKAGR